MRALQARIAQLELMCEANDQVLRSARDQVLAAQAMTAQRDRELAASFLQMNVGLD